MKRVLLVVLLSMVVPLSPASAQGVSVEVRVILASREPDGPTDPAIRSLVQELQRDFAYASYRLLETQTGRLASQRPWRTSIAGGLGLSVALVGADRGRVELQIRTAGVNTRVRLQRGGPPFLVGGPPHQKGVLIIAIFAH